MSLTRADLAAIEQIVQRAVASALDSRRRSDSGIGALVEGDRQCHEKEESVYTDHSTEDAVASGGESSSPELTAARLLSRSRARARHNVLPMPRAHRAKGER